MNGRQIGVGLKKAILVDLYPLFS